MLKKLNKDQQDKWKEFKETVKVIGEYEKALWLANELSNVIPFNKLKPICNFLEQEYKTYRSIIYEENIDLSITKATKQDLDRLEQDLKDTEDFLMKRDKYLNDYVKNELEKQNKNQTRRLPCEVSFFCDLFYMFFSNMLDFYAILW